MGLLSKLGGAVKEGIRKGAVNGLLKATGNSAATGQVQFSEYSYDANGNIKGVNPKYAADIANRYGSTTDGNNDFGVEGNFGGLAASQSGVPRHDVKNKISKYPEKFNSADGLDKHTSVKTRDEYSWNDFKVNKDTNSDIYHLKLPDWSYVDFINERAI